MLRTGIVRSCAAPNRKCSEPVWGSAQNRFWAVLRTGIVRPCLAPNRKCSEPVLGSVPEPVLGLHRTGNEPLPVSGMLLLLNTAIELPRTGIVQLLLWGVTCLVLNTGIGAQNRFCAVLRSKPVLSTPSHLLLVRPCKDGDRAPRRASRRPSAR